jgi:hypothetical protein
MLVPSNDTEHGRRGRLRSSSYRSANAMCTARHTDHGRSASASRLLLSTFRLVSATIPMTCNASRVTSRILRPFRFTVLIRPSPGSLPSLIRLCYLPEPYQRALGVSGAFLLHIAFTFLVKLCSLYSHCRSIFS